ncbi:MAG: tetratricopeptide repeat protein [Promethearchaeota archaeon]|nr:MAG: tetratricopeptide repeat protein [Candidatus Lokiarchaeota archaeon]
MEKPNISSLENLFTEQRDLTFLVGAGCSVDPPSCLPAGQTMMKSIIKYTCPKSEIENILNIKDLRFEGLIETVRDYLDKELKIIDFYGVCDKPNLQHYFLADMITKGHYVMTTNFDFLIEYALQNMDIPKEKIKIIITKYDFENYYNPKSLLENQTKTLYKIHGSTKNIIEGKNTKDSLIATIQAFGSNKEGIDVFQIEPYKRPLFENISEQRTLVVMGYSGSDDFDIVPTLKILKNLTSLVWINYIPHDGGREEIYEINEYTIQNPIDNDKVNSILTEIYLMGNLKNIYRINANTSRIIEEFMTSHHPATDDVFELQPLEWLEENLPHPTEMDKISIASSIYLNFGQYNDIIRLASKGLNIAREKRAKAKVSHFLNLLGLAYHYLSENEDSLKHFEEAYEIDKKLGLEANKVIGFLNMTLVYSNLGQFDKAEEILNELLDLEEVQKNIEIKAKIFSTKGSIYKKRGQFNNAITLYQQAQKINEELGNLYDKSINLNNIAGIYTDLREFSRAKRKLEEALKIRKELGYYKGLISTYINLGVNYRNQGKYGVAIDNINKALKLSETLGYKDGISKSLNRLGSIHLIKKDFEKAYEYFVPAYKMSKETGNKLGMILANTNIGTYYLGKKKYEKAISTYKKSIEIADSIGSILEKAHAIYNIALTDYEIGNYQKAKEKFLETLELYEQVSYEHGKGPLYLYLGDISMKSGDFKEAEEFYLRSLRILKEFEKFKDSIELKNLYTNIGINSFYQQKYKEALDSYYKALDVSENINNAEATSICYNNIGLVYQNLKNYDKAIENFKKALAISTDMEDSGAMVIHLQNLAINYIYIEDYSHSQECIERALEILEDTNNGISKSMFYNLFGVILYKEQEYEKALINYKRAIDANPQNDVAFYNLACVNSIQNNFDDALQYLKSAITLNPQYKKSALTEEDLKNIRSLESFKEITGV